jgi:hypothetical protein
MIDDPALLMFLQNEQTRAVDVKLNDERATALAFYNGDPFGDEVEGRSQLRTRDVAEVVDYATVTIMRTMISGDKIVEFEPLSPMMVEGEPGEDGQPVQKDMAGEYAQEASERIHWNFLREQDGYSILQDGVKAGLLEKTGVWKSWVETPFEFQSHMLNADEIDERDDIVNADPVDDMYDIHPETMEPLQVYDAMVRVPGKPQFRDAAVPNEDFFVASDARTLDSAIYLGDQSRQSLAQLVEMGYAWEDVEDLWGDGDAQGQRLSDARDANRGNVERDVARRDWNRIVVLREEYCRWFFQGRYQLVRVHRVGTKILSVIAAPMQPYTLWCPFPMQHRLVGHSLADKVLDIQVVRSHMLRQAMDSLYLANTPRMAIDMTGALPETIDDALDVAPGGLIRYKGNAPTPLAIPFVGGNAFEAMQIMAAEKENRTGITRLNRGLNADALNTETATEFRGLQEGGQQIEEYIARNAANAIAELFEKKLMLMRAHMDEHSFKIDGEFRDINPQQWPDDMRIGVRVGLGTGNKDKRLQSIRVLAEAMDDAEQFGLVTPENAFAAAKTLVGTLGLGAATQFFTDPATKKDEPPQPDPAMVELQAKQQQAAMDMDLRQQEAAARIQLAREESAARLDLERAKAETETQLARERMTAEFQLKREQMIFTAQTSASLSQDRPGGRLDA